MADWLSESQLVNNISKDLMQPRQQHYSEDSYRMSIEQHPKLRIKHFQQNNRFGQKIYGVLVDTRQKVSDYCLIFMHGLGSNILQGSILIDQITPNIALCCFDFSGSGKSQGSFNSYGTKEYQDISAIINYLEKQGYKKVILWGRSMGAFASLAYTTALSTRISMTSSCIIMQILDSPFSNFEDVCKNRARNHYKIPQIFIDPAINLLKKNMSNHQFSPFQLDLNQRAHLCNTYTLFVYNENDNVIPIQNLQKLIQQLSKNCPYERLIINDQHCNLRSKQTLNLIFEKIRKFLFRRQSTQEKGKNKRKALNLYSGFIKKGELFKSEDYKKMSQIQKTQKKQKRKGALFCSLSKKICSDFNNKGLKLIGNINPQVKQI